MAVSTQKLLPSAKGSPLAKISTAKISKGMSIKTKTIDTKKLMGAKEDEKENIKQTLLDIDSLLKSILGEEKKNQSKKRKEKEKSDFEKEEKKLEAPKESKKFKLPGLNVPGASFLDRIKRFLFFTALGWLFTRLQDQLPKLEGIVKTITQVYVVAEGIFKGLLNGLVNFIDIGYQTYDGLRKKVEDLGGKDAVKTFDEFSGHLNKLINGAIMASLLIASTNPKILSTSKKPTGAATAAAPKQPPTKQKILPPAGPKGPLDRIGRGIRGAGAKLETGTLFKKGAGIQKALYNAPGKLKGLVPKGGGGALSRGAAAVRLPVVGPLVTFIVRRYVYGEKPSRAAAAAVGTAIGEMIGMFGGAAIAGGGTFFTGGLGAVAAPFVIGGLRLAGALAGEWIATKLYDFVTGAEVPKPQLKAAGGSVTRGGKRQGAVSRSIRTTRNKRPPKVKPKQSQPGKDVGGKKNIQKLYPDPSAITEIEGEQKSPWFDLLPTDPKERNNKLKKLPNPYKALTGVAKTLKDIPFGIGALMGGAVDIALGEKLPQNAIDSLGNGIAYLINAVASQKVSASISDIGKEISKMQTGGVVPRLRDLSKQDKVGMDITKELNNLIRQKVDQAIKEVQKQMMPGKFGDETKTDESKKKRNEETSDVPGAKLRDGSNAQIEADLLEYFTALYGKNAAIGIVANLRRESGYRTKTPENRSYEGMAQWDRNDRWPRFVKWAEGKGLDPYNRSAQAQYITVELKQLGTDKRLKGTKSAEAAARLFYIEFERGADRNNYEGSDTETKHNNFIKDISSKNPEIGKRKDEVLVKPSSPKPDIPTTGTGQYVPDERGTKLSGDLGDFMKSWGGVPGSIWQHSRHGGQGRRSYPSYHNVDRAIDLGAYANEQGPILRKIEEFNKLKGVKPVQLLHAGNDSTGGHDDHVHVAYQGGGYVPKQSPNRKVSSLRSYPSYSEGGMMIAIQPMIIEKPVPMPMGNSKTIMFPVAVGVNNSMNLINLSQG